MIEPPIQTPIQATKLQLANAIRTWDRFFFAPFAALPLAVFRIVFGSTIAIMYLLRFANWRFYFTDEGYIPASRAMEAIAEFYRPDWPIFPSTPTAAWFSQLALLVVLVSLVIGFFPRISALIAFGLHLALIQRNVAIVYGGDLVTTFFLFGMIFSDSGRALSVMSLWRRRTESVAGERADLFSTFGVRLIQLQLCIIYGYSGMEKLKGASWWDGTAVWAVIGNHQLMMFDTSWLRRFPLMIAAATLSSVLFEIYFPVLVWLKPLRKWMLIVGFTMHALIALTVGLVFFSMVMISAYLLFIDDETYRLLYRLIGRRFNLRQLEKRPGL